MIRQLLGTLFSRLSRKLRRSNTPKQQLRITPPDIPKVEHFDSMGIELDLDAALTGRGETRPIQRAPPWRPFIFPFPCLSLTFGYLTRTILTQFSMGRGPTVQAQKDKNAKVKAKVNTLHAKLISIAAEKGADISQNNALADVIHAAKKDGVTADVIDRAIRRGAGLDKESAKVEEIIYEGYAPGGVAVIVRALTDNRNRTAPSIRHIFSAYGGSLGETGTVSNFAFAFHGVIVIREYKSSEELELAVMETSAEDYRIEDDVATIYT
ncbi:YebC/PmpR family DNA-binding transcriptional regulator, partial [Candidatus Gracilibacteria bacterium]|nr:YebC/PmpR family DNA-binding transcriptional regulator [Candidatus Gracilibacteria bacterium]